MNIVVVMVQGNIASDNLDLNSEFTGESIDLTEAPNRRQYPRSDTFILAEAFTDKDQSLAVIVNNLSLSGLGLEVSQRVLERLIPHTQSRGIPLPIQVVFTLSEGASAGSTIKANCAITHTRRVSQDVFVVGMQFVSINSGLDALSDYIKSKVDIIANA